jgi:hypothetical protein
MGSILLQKGESLGWPVNKIESALTSKERTSAPLWPPVTTTAAWRKYPDTPTRRQPSSRAKQQTICISRFPDSTLPIRNAHKRADDLLDDYTYGLIIAFGSGDAI